MMGKQGSVRGKKTVKFLGIGVLAAGLLLSPSMVDAQERGKRQGQGSVRNSGKANQRAAGPNTRPANRPGAGPGGAGGNRASARAGYRRGYNRGRYHGWQDARP